MPTRYRRIFWATLALLAVVAAGLALLGPIAVVFVVPYVALLFWPAFLEMSGPRTRRHHRKDTRRAPAPRFPASDDQAVAPPSALESLNTQHLREIARHNGLKTDPDASKPELIRRLRRRMARLPLTMPETS